MATVKPDLSQQWASDGDKIAPSGAKIQAGWGPEIPPYQWENWVQNRQDQMLAHINERGIPEWDSSTEYESGKSYVQDSNGIIYIAIQSGSGQNPATEAAYWTPLEQRQIVVFNTPGVFPWTVPEILKLGGRKVKVTVIGGGGGGGGATSQASRAGGGGGGGASGFKLIDLAGVSSVDVTVGAGGAGAVGPSAGAPGGASSFGAFVSCPGGGGGSGGQSSSAPTIAGQGGGTSPVGADYGFRGGAGGPGVTLNDSARFSGHGGSSFLSGNAGGNSADGSAAYNSGANGGGYGGGGAGGLSGGGQFVSGGNGSAGIVIIEW